MSVAALAPLSAARQALAEADTLPDLASLVDYAEAAKVAAKRAGLSEEAVRDWQLFSLEAQRKAGELLANLPGYGRGLKSVTVADLGINHSKAKRWQGVAEIPENLFRDYLEKAREPNRARLLRLGRHAARAASEELREPGTVTLDADLRVGRFQDVLADLTNVDAIITDPPYPYEYIPQLGDLAKWADDVLAPDGVLAVLIGQVFLNEVMAVMEGHRPYRWTMAYLMPGAQKTIYTRNIHQSWKPILVYGAGPRMYDTVTSTGDDKTLHYWGQNYPAFETLVTRMTEPGALVVDPFMGGGTTALAAFNTGRRFVGCDIDPTAVDTTRQRLATSREGSPIEP